MIIFTSKLLSNYLTFENNTDIPLKINEQNESEFLQKLMNKANIGWWEADLKAETYKCSELISQLLGIGEDGLISFEDFNKRILKEDQGYATFPSFDKVQQTVEENILV